MRDPQILNQVAVKKRGYVCNVPGSILVFEGRCKPNPNSLETVQFAECRKRLIEIEGEAAYLKRIQSIMEKHGITENEAISGDQVGHIEMAVHKGASKPGVLNFVSYSRRAMPASHFDDGRAHGMRILVACYLPREDAQALLQQLK